MSKILERFLSEVTEKMNTNKTDQMFDITTILTKNQNEKFERLNTVMRTLLSGDNLAEGLERVVGAYDLSENEQMTFLMIMKMMEAIIDDDLSELTNSFASPDAGMYQ